LKDGNLYSTYLQGVLPDEALRLSGKYSFTARGRDGHDILYEFNIGAGPEITGLSLNTSCGSNSERETDTAIPAIYQCSFHNEG